jgi:uncharacterized membrane protein
VNGVRANLRWRLRRGLRRAWRAAVRVLTAAGVLVLYVVVLTRGKGW